MNIQLLPGMVDNIFGTICKPKKGQQPPKRFPPAEIYGHVLNTILKNAFSGDITEFTQFLDKSKETARHTIRSEKLFKLVRGEVFPTFIEAHAIAEGVKVAWEGSEANAKAKMLSEC